MTNPVALHYGGSGTLADKIAANLKNAGKDISSLATTDLASVDEFHIRGRKATLELAGHLQLSAKSQLLDIGSGLGGPARTVAEQFGCRVTGLDLTPAFCEAAAVLSSWVGLADKVSFQEGDATRLPMGDDTFDAAMTIHVAMNIVAKDQMYSEAKRVVKPGGRIGIYDVLQGEGGDVLYPVPWAREPSISHLATPDDMKHLLMDAGLNLLEVDDSTGESLSWFQVIMDRMEKSGPPPVTFQTFLGGDFPEMVRNQIRNLAERRIRTVTYICETRI